MGRKPLPVEERKEKITIALPKWLIDELKEMTNYNEFILKAVLKELKK